MSTASARCAQRGAAPVKADKSLMVQQQEASLQVASPSCACRAILSRTTRADTATVTSFGSPRMGAAKLRTFKGCPGGHISPGNARPHAAAYALYAGRHSVEGGADKALHFGRALLHSIQEPIRLGRPCAAVDTLFKSCRVRTLAQTGASQNPLYRHSVSRQGPTCRLR